MRFLAILLGVLAVIAGMIVFGAWLFYFIEDARGAKAWAATVKEIRDAGEPATAQDLIPPEIPDDQNLAALPLFRLEADHSDNNEIHDVALDKALEPILPAGAVLPASGYWVFGQPADIGPPDKYVAERYRKAFGHEAKGLDLTGEIDALCPALDELRRANATRPLCRFARDYVSEPPYARPLGSITQLIRLAKILNLHALAALRDKHPELALQDIEVTLKLNEGARLEPILVSGLVAIGINAIQTQSVCDGLHQHAWNDAQLARLQADFARVDFLTDYQLCLRGEGMNFYGPTLDYLRDHRDQTKLLGSMSADAEERAPDISEIIGWLTPRGSFDSAKSDGVGYFYRSAREPVDVVARRVYPEKAARLVAFIGTIQGYSLSSILLRISAGPVLKSARNFSDGQIGADLTQIAFALERYRLAKGTYPKSLDQLATYAPRGFPHDPVSGDPYIYRLHLDGTYLLYSVGWNETDDGGKCATKSDGKSLDREHGDWVWPCPDAKPLVSP